MLGCVLLPAWLNVPMVQLPTLPAQMLFWQSDQRCWHDEQDQWRFCHDRGHSFPRGNYGGELSAAFEALSHAQGRFACRYRMQGSFCGEPRSRPPVRALMDAYCSTTGKQVRPFTMGGGTYAREFSMP